MSKINRGRQIINDLNKSIAELEKTAGHDIHSEKWKRCVEHVKEKGGADNPYAVCTTSLGVEAMKSFAKSDDLTDGDMQKINTELLKCASEKLMTLVKGAGIEEPMVEEPSVTVPFIVTQTSDMLWGQSPLPSPATSFDLPGFRKDNDL